MLDFLKGALSESDGTPSSKRLVYTIVIVSGVVLCWYILLKFGVIDQLLKLMDSLIYSSSAAYGVGRGLENSSALNNFGNPGVPSPKISDFMAQKLAAKNGTLPPNPPPSDPNDIGIVPKAD